MRKVFLFDLDDTLMRNEYTYSLATMKFFDLLLEVFNKRLPFIGGVAHRVEEVSHSMVKENDPATGQPFGFSINRFPETLVRCYEELCENGWGEYRSEIAEQVRTVGLSAFDKELYKKTGLVDNAVETLRFLEAQGDILALITKGDPEVQKRKIEALELHRWFPFREVVDKKDEELFLRWKHAFGDVNPLMTFSVGNSFSSDIRPALKAGIGAIFIPCYTWKAESIEKDELTNEEQQRFYQAKEIKEVIEIYGKL